MLKKLSVTNFALIENAQLDLTDGFTVITGETGSGKSILLGALKLILGERADYSVIRDKNKKTIVEAVFSIPSNPYLSFFEKYDLDFEHDSIIRREINAKGKTRAFINDTPIQLSILKELTSQLIHIHSQHHTLSLKDKNFQLNILDGLAGNETDLKQFKQQFKSTLALRKSIDKLKEKQAQLMLELDFNQFQLEELNQLNLAHLNYEEIEEEVGRGEKLEEIKAAYGQVIHILDSEEGVLNQLNSLRREINVDEKNIENLSERLQSVWIELKDIADTAENELDEAIINPEELQEKTAQLDAFNTCLRKHNLQTQEDLMQLEEQLSKEIIDSSKIEEDIESQEKELSKSMEIAMKLAQSISQKRKKKSTSIEKEIEQLLAELKLEGTKVQFSIQPQELSENGLDDVSLFFAPNKGMEPQPIEKSASGGELSRLMLVVQYLLSKQQDLPSIIFDEIDTGVSGEVAQRIGELLKKMGEKMQLIAITHLPQVASKGSRHILVEKKDIQNQTNTILSVLNREERIVEIAKLMSGSTINEAALSNAKTLMNE